MTTYLSFPSARMTGWKNGWDQPANTAARLGHDFGYNVLPALIVFAFVTFFVAKLSRRGAFRLYTSIRSRPDRSTAALLRSSRAGAINVSIRKSCGRLESLPQVST